MTLDTVSILDSLVPTLGTREALSLAQCRRDLYALVRTRTKYEEDLSVIRLWRLICPKQKFTPIGGRILWERLVAYDTETVETLLRVDEVYLDRANHDLLLEKVLRLGQHHYHSISAFFISLSRGVVRKIEEWKAADVANDTEAADGKTMLAFELLARAVLHAIEWLIAETRKGKRFGDHGEEGPVFFMDSLLLQTLFTKMKYFQEISGEITDPGHPIPEISHRIAFNILAHDAATHIMAWVTHLQTGKPVHQGPMGGLYTLGKKGRKVYLRRY